MESFFYQEKHAVLFMLWFHDQAFRPSTTQTKGTRVKAEGVVILLQLHL